MIAPTPLQSDQAAIVQADVLELFGRLSAEGVDWRVALAGTASAIANVLMQQVGQAEVPVWFARMSATTMHLAKPSA